jgi:glycine oxidase
MQDVILYGRGHYLLTRGEEVWAGATMEHAGFDAPTTEEGIERIRNTADQLCPLIHGSPVARTWAGLRPGTPDGLPILGPEPRAEGCGTPPATAGTASCLRASPGSSSPR